MNVVISESIFGLIVKNVYGFVKMKYFHDISARKFLDHSNFLTIKVVISPPLKYKAPP